MAFNPFQSFPLLDPWTAASLGLNPIYPHFPLQSVRFPYHQPPLYPKYYHPNLTPRPYSPAVSTLPYRMPNVIVPRNSVVPRHGVVVIQYQNSGFQPRLGSFRHQFWKSDHNRITL